MLVQLEVGEYGIGSRQQPKLDAVPIDTPESLLEWSRDNCGGYDEVMEAGEAQALIDETLLWCRKVAGFYFNQNEMRSCLCHYGVDDIDLGFLERD